MAAIKTVSQAQPTPAPAAAVDAPVASAELRAQLLRAFGVVVLLAIQLILAERSLIQENPTVDEVAHLPAGVTYWQKGTYRLYPHNPPLVKLIAAAPVVFSKPVTDPLYNQKSWISNSPSQATFSQSFARLNVDRYFELFESARALMPIFLAIGGVVVYLWSSRLYGPWGGFLSLALWCFCPNMLAHGRLITTDAGSTALGAAATYVFWRYLQSPSSKWAVTAGVGLGLAQLSKFSMLLLFAIWPTLWLVRLLLAIPRPEWPARAVKAVGHALIVLALTVLVIDIGYRFEGVGIPLGDYEFACRTLTTKVPAGIRRPPSENDLLNIAWKHRINRFRGTILARIPVPLPRFYLQGFDEQKLEAEGIPKSWFPAAPGEPKAENNDDNGEVAGYRVYLNGVMRNTGWWYYYFVTFFYKVPEGTLLILAFSLIPLVRDKRNAASWADEITLATIPVVIMITMSFFTDINLGLRYVLAIFPYLYIAAGKLAPWVATMAGTARRLATGAIVGCLAGTIAATLWIHPHYLAYFNWASGGPDRSPARLIDSNLDWGQDLVGLRKWCARSIPGTPIGLAYFGQINPSIFTMRDEPFSWFLPPIQPESAQFMYKESERSNVAGFASKLTPGYYAISTSILYGLPWRLYDPSPRAWDPAWNVHKVDAFGYFRAFTPIARIGHSIQIYKLTQEDIDRNAPTWLKSASRAD